MRETGRPDERASATAPPSTCRSPPGTPLPGLRIQCRGVHDQGGRPLAGLLELVVLPQLVEEIHAIERDAERRTQLTALDHYRRPPLEEPDLERMRRALIEAAWEDLGLELPRTGNDLVDLAYVVQARAAGVPHLITRDAGLLELTPVAEKVCGVRLLVFPLETVKARGSKPSQAR
ncbi:MULTISPECIES: hypothetical protein [Streptomyces albidoflavus group]|nr:MULTISPECIES: hypothetical protein [Streptomyces albidoflavus group]